MINDYNFGTITVDGKEYNQDIMIVKDGSVFLWRRNASHLIEPEDIEKALDENPKIIVIGTGSSGMARVREKTITEIKNKGIEFAIEPTPKAIEIFNNLKSKKAIGFFHLTC